MKKISETFSNAWFSATFIWSAGLLQGIDLVEGGRPGSGPCSPFGPELQRIVRGLRSSRKGRLARPSSGQKPADALLRAGSGSPAPRGASRLLHDLRPPGRHVRITPCRPGRGWRHGGKPMAPAPSPATGSWRQTWGWAAFGPGLPLKRTLLTLEGALPRK